MRRRGLRDALRARRGELALSQAQAAKRLRVAVQTYQRWEEGYAPRSREHWMALVAFLERPLGDVVWLAYDLPLDSSPAALAAKVAELSADLQALRDGVEPDQWPRPAPPPEPTKLDLLHKVLDHARYGGDPQEREEIIWQLFEFLAEELRRRSADPRPAAPPPAGEGNPDPEPGREPGSGSGGSAESRRSLV